LKFYYNLQSLIYLFIILMMCSAAYGQSKLLVDDGPYIFLEKGGYVVKTIHQNKLKSKHYDEDTPTEYSNLNFPLHLREPLVSDNHAIYHGVSKIAAISDIHGQYDVMIKLFQVNGIVDQNNQWLFGDGHLVITGDIFDRGDQVTEILWYIYELEEQARQAGGQVHFLLGNHELMILEGDTRYIHKKYRYTMALTNMLYHQLFSPNTVLGQWMRTKNISIKINDIVFVHGGFSNRVLDYGIDLDSLNQVFRKELIDKPLGAIKKDNTLSDLYFEEGPLWYRGYASENFTENDADEALAGLECDHIVVGHTSMESIVSLFEDKIIFIDSSIKFGKKGEILFWEEGLFKKGDIFGAKMNLAD